MMITNEEWERLRPLLEDLIGWSQNDPRALAVNLYVVIRQIASILKEVAMRK